MCTIVNKALTFNNKFIKSYFAIYKKIKEEYDTTQPDVISSPFDYVNSKYYGYNIDVSTPEVKLEKITQLTTLAKIESGELSLNIHEDDSIYKAIMEDDKNSLIEFTKKFDFNKHQTLESDFYPNTIHHIFGRNALSLLELCCYHGSINCFNFLTTELKLEITQGCVSYSFLSGNKEIIDKCLAEKDPNFVTMEYAVISRNIDYVNLLMDEHDLFPDYEGAAYYNNLQAFIIGLKKCRYINDYFFHSLYFGFEPVYEIILSLGANINAVKIKNNVPLIHWCAIYNNVEFAQFLISHGADLEIKNDFGKTALFLSIKHKTRDVAELLILNGAGFKVKSSDGKTYLHWAAAFNCKEIAELLIFNGAEIDARDGFKNTPLHVAASENSVDVAELLISHGADINAKDGFGNKPINFAMKKNNKEMIDLLTVKY